MLGSIHDHHPVCTHRQPPAGKVASHSRPLVRAPSVRLIAQQSLQVASAGELAQGRSQQLGLTWQQRIVEVQIHRTLCYSLLVNPETARKRRRLYKGAAAGLATDQPHCGKLRINARGSDQSKAFLIGKLSVGWQARTRRQATRPNFGGENVYQLLISGVSHVAMYP
jgi:hypothetical protein